MAQARAQAEPETERPEVVLVSAMRNEGPFVLEWLAYHRVIGVDRVVIVSNGSTDGSDDLLAALAAAGEITFLRTTPGYGVAPQDAAVQAFEAEVGYTPGAWYLWLDADEFLNVHVGDRTVHALVDRVGLADGLMLNWRLFGSNGNDSFPGRYVSEDFIGASKLGFVANLETKPMFRAGEKFAGFSANSAGLPRLVDGAAVKSEDCLGGNGRPLDPNNPRTAPWLDRQTYTGRTNLASRREFGWDLAQINHYSVRTPDHFRLKAARGRGMVSTGPRRPNVRHTAAYFDRFDRNEAEDRSILHWEAAVTREIARLMALPGVAEAKATVDALVAAALAEIATQTAEPLDEGLLEPATRVMRGMDAEMEQEAEAPSFELTFAPKERRFLVRYYEAATTILEYGSGGSTVLAAKLGKTVFTVESDQDWAERMAHHVASISDKAHVHWADVGPTGPWGVPMKPREFRKFSGYALSVWDRPDFEQPDLVLIDGRFRASCLVAVLLRATKPVTVLFDDYLKRGYYHGVERLARKEETVGRMARFTVTPGAIPPEMATQAIGWFTDPR
ncbi:glycosyltransferase family 2 protein [Rhodobacter sp. SY28-1]|uniref:glycosyltransferase family 2 protein n=1 Tax=Rhodobacter sp. SY28-1 TaxID=2562317 RepID=UPI0010C0A701|nr:glycosyltransferase family 2 protein [Rhodobacter sp. SY28-1]